MDAASIALLAALLGTAVLLCLWCACCWSPSTESDAVDAEGAVLRLADTPFEQRQVEIVDLEGVACSINTVIVQSAAAAAAAASSSGDSSCRAGTAEACRAVG